MKIETVIVRNPIQILRTGIVCRSIVQPPNGARWTIVRSRREKQSPFFAASVWLVAISFYHCAAYAPDDVRQTARKNRTSRHCNRYILHRDLYAPPG